jgi:hypothetical protein
MEHALIGHTRSRYASEVSSINIWHSARYGVGCPATRAQFPLAR